MHSRTDSASASYERITRIWREVENNIAEESLKSTCFPKDTKLPHRPSRLSVCARNMSYDRAVGVFVMFSIFNWGGY